MYAFDDLSKFIKVLDLTVPWAHSYADMRPGKTDLERRENYRAAAVQTICAKPDVVFWWAFRITVTKSGRRLDVDNVAKTIIDSFSASQLKRDGSKYSDLALYADDTFDEVRILQVIGNPKVNVDSTHIEVFACIQE